MTIKDLKKNTAFILALIALLLVLLPFGIEQIGDLVGYQYEAYGWVKKLFKPKSTQSGGGTAARAEWEKKLKDIEEFSKWTEGLAEAKISIVRPEEFQIVRAMDATGYESTFSWKLLLISDSLSSNATQVREHLKLIYEPEGEISGEIGSITSLPGNEKGFLVTARKISGKGMMGLSYKDLPPCFYDVKLRNMWLVPVASCRSALRGRYNSAVYFTGMERGLTEGDIISPGTEKCGYRILSISDHCVWFEAFDTDTPDPDTLPHSIWPDFSRVDTLKPTPPPGRLIFGKNRCFWPNDAIKLPNTGSYLLVDTFLLGRAAVFRLLDSSMHPVAKLLCVIVREK